MSSIVFDESGQASTPGNILVYHFDQNSGEYMGWSDEYIPIGVSLPGSSTSTPPGKESEGFVKCFNGNSWVDVEDHRDETVYSTENKTTAKVNYLGIIRDGYTTQAPSSKYDEWDGEKWVKNQSAELEGGIEEATLQRNALRATADYEIAWLNDAVVDEIATEEEQKLLSAWKNYRVQIMRIDTTKYPEIEWPSSPAS